MKIFLQRKIGEQKYIVNFIKGIHSGLYMKTIWACVHAYIFHWKEWHKRKPINLVGEKMEIYIVRHGTTPWNEKRKLQGRVDIELNEAGREVARLTGIALEGTKFDKIYSSPLIRAYETACLIRSNKDNIPIIRDERLREIHFGDFEGQSAIELQKDQSNSFHYFFTEPEKYQKTGEGEDFIEVCKRTKEFMKQVIEPEKDDLERVMIVGHGAMNKAIMCYVLNHGIEQYWSGGLQTNCGIDIINLDDNGYTLIQRNKKFY